MVGTTGSVLIREVSLIRRSLIEKLHYWDTGMLWMYPSNIGHNLFILPWYAKGFENVQESWNTQLHRSYKNEYQPYRSPWARQLAYTFLPSLQSEWRHCTAAHLMPCVSISPWQLLLALIRRYLTEKPGTVSTYQCILYSGTSLLRTSDLN